MDLSKIIKQSNVDKIAGAVEKLAAQPWETVAGGGAQPATKSLVGGSPNRGVTLRAPNLQPKIAPAAADTARGPATFPVLPRS